LSKLEIKRECIITDRNICPHEEISGLKCSACVIPEEYNFFLQRRQTERVPSMGDTLRKALREL